jgi:Zn finger protein HypA/HybF involved in hydrogenase expression
MKIKLFDLKCSDCNKFFRNPDENEKICPECRRIKEKKKPKVNYGKSVNQILKELEKYNEEHKTRLSYGQYVALVDK